MSSATDGRQWWATPDSPMSECALCGTPHHKHVVQEKSGDLQHQWTSSSGQMHPVDRSNRPQTLSQETPVIIAPAPDILLRQLLRDMGVITQAQYDQLWGK